MIGAARLVAANMARKLVRWLMIAAGTISLLGVTEWINAR
ncbi:hypothetical protein FuraDRAFT_0254 [Pseudogulbenkiania ferrooxidans 2002]|uniref:Uncharacterized protein n=1 Tax=Pseudogulbenkiania ferrooxidans 2002 TaxID=279714 RepID=B9YYR9_9NEIS|nr:hypothetical protein FuraDRAFT_0254 [Pseudogulbenkiania ferrooxidans 2002]